MQGKVSLKFFNPKGTNIKHQGKYFFILNTLKNRFLFKIEINFKIDKSKLYKKNKIYITKEIEIYLIFAPN